MRYQPQGLARVNRSNSLTTGLVFLYLPGLLADASGRYPATALNANTIRKGGSIVVTGSDRNGLLAGSAPLLGPLQNSTVLSISSVTTDSRAIYCERGSSGNDIYKLECPSGGAGFTYRNDSGNLLQIYASNAGISDGKQRMFVATKAGTAHFVACYPTGNTSAASISNTGTFGSTSTAFTDSTLVRTIGYDIADGSQAYAGQMDLVAGWSRALSAAEIESIRRNPWQLFDTPDDDDYLTTTVADTSLTAGATAISAAFGSLSTSIPLNAAANAAASVIGALSTSIRMTGSAVAVASGAGLLTTSIKLTGATSAQASAAGSLTTVINLVANATASASASGTLSGGAAQLTGAAATTAATSGVLTTAIVLSGAAQAVATASAITAGGAAQLSGTASASASAAGQVTTLINLSGAATSTAAAAANGTFFGAGAQLSGAATASASASSMLTTAIALAGAVIAQASASAALVGQSVTLAGSTSARASVSGVLSTGIGLAAAARAVSSGQAALTTQIAMVAIAQAQATAASDLSTRSQIDASMIPPGHIVSFASRSRVVTFRGKSRIVRF